MAKRKKSTKKSTTCVCTKPSPFRAGLAFGIVWGLGVFILGLVAIYAEGYASPVMELIGSVYLGYAASLVGSILGLIWGFIDGFIGGFLIVWVYNFLAK